MKNELYNVHAHSVNLTTREVYLHSYYSDDEEEPGVEYRQATTFIKNIHLLDRPPYKPIVIHLHSEGGCSHNGMAVFNTIEFSKSKVKMICYAQASSMSGIILQAAPLRIMMPDCFYLIHFGWHESGSLLPMASKNGADQSIKIGERMLEIFAKRAINGVFFQKKKGTTLKSVYRFFDKKIKENVDWYLDAEQSVYYGLADGIIGTKEFPNVHSVTMCHSEE